MSTIHVKRDSHVQPEKYRINTNDAKRILLPGAEFEENPQLPVISTSLDVAIIGGGFAGLASSLMCKKKFSDKTFAVFEKHSNWGGTWWANTYPGCASDIPALWYSIFGELCDNWSDIRPPQYEIEEYILSVVRKYDLNKNANFETAVNVARYDETSGLWILDAVNIKTGQRYEHKAKCLLLCLGGLVFPNNVNIPGLKDKFKGAYMHSALFDHSVDFKDKKVVVIGNGCSAAQLVPALMDKLEVKSVTQLVRSKHWIMPPLPSYLNTVYKLLAGTRWGLIFVRWIVAFVAETRYPMYYGNGILARLMRYVNTYQSKHYIQSIAPKKYHDMLLPSYKIGCKRLIFDYYYIPSLKNPKFDMSDSAIQEVTENAVILKDGRKVEADIIVACTGYDLRRVVGSCKVIGRNEVNLKELWDKEGITAYRTSMVRDMPNMFFIGGPNSATGHSSVVTAIENTVAFAERSMRDVLYGKAKSVTVKTSAYYKWFETVQAKLKTAVFGSKFGGCVSWYTEDGVNATSYHKSQLYFWWDLRYGSLSELDYEPIGGHLKID